MSDSVKLQFEHGIWCLVFSYVCLVALITGILLMIFISGFFIFLAVPAVFAFIFLIIAAIEYLKKAIEISKKEEEK